MPTVAEGVFLFLALYSTGATPDVAGHLGPDENQAAISRFESEAPQAWAHWKEMLRDQQYSVEIVTYSHRGGVQNGEYRKSFCRAGSRTLSNLVLPATGKVPAREIAWGRNDSYYFVIKQTDGAPWTVMDFGRPDQRPADTEKRYPNEDRSQYAQFTIEGVPLEQLVSDPTFVVESVADQSPKDEFQVRFQSRVGPDEWTTITGGTLSFQPQKYWLLGGYDLQLQSRTAGTASARMTYRELGSLPVVEQWSLDYQFEGDEPIRNLHELTWSDNACPDEQFTLSHFGLPEPEFDSTQRGRSWRPWFFYASLAFLAVVAILIRRLSAKPVSRH